MKIYLLFTFPGLANIWPNHVIRHSYSKSECENGPKVVAAPTYRNPSSEAKSTTYVTGTLRVGVQSNSKLNLKKKIPGRDLFMCEAC